jgi:hypothetical protein
MKNFYFLCAGVLMSVTVAAQSTGPLSGTTFGNSPLAGSNKNWTNVANAASSNNLYASFGNLGPGVGTHTDYLRVTNFGFNIPGGDAVTGIQVEIERSDPNQNTSDYSIKIIWNGLIVGPDHSTGLAYPGADAYLSYGGSTDTWGQTWTPTDINNSNFGVVIAAQRNSSGNTGGQIDHVRITVFHSTILPIKLLNFTLQKNQSSIGLSWTTAEESNMDHFEIERAENGRDFVSVGSVPTRNQLTQTNYSFEDKKPLKNISYYRLKIVGNQGDVTYSKIIPVRFNSTGSTVGLYPVPWHRGTPLNIVNPNGDKLTVQFFNGSGQLISSTTTVSDVIPNKSLSGLRGWNSYKIFNESHQLLGVGKLFVVN